MIFYIYNLREWYPKNLEASIMCVIVNKTVGLLAQCIKIVSKILVLPYMVSF